MQKLIITNLNFKFNREKNYFFRNVHLSFETGKMYFIQGKNGVGKSTFFSILQGTIPQNVELTGSITFNDTPHVIKNNCMIPQLCSYIKTMLQDSNKMIVTSMTAVENIHLAQLTRYPGLGLFNTSFHLPSLLAEFNIKPTSNVAYLSGGQKQILAIIMMLQKPTKILLLDEPTAALDDNNSHLVIRFLEKIATQLDLILMIITHDKELIETYKQHQKIIIKKENEDTRVIDMI